jgi:hypothetical protein
LPVKTVPALTAAQFNLTNIPPIYWEDLAGLRPAGAINKAAPLFCQHRTGKEQVTAGAALMAIAFTDKKLALNIFLSEMNQPKTP